MKREKRILAVSILLLMLIIYSSIQRLIAEHNAGTMVTRIDELIPFVPSFIVFYFAFFILMVLPFFIIEGIQEYRKVIASYLLIVFVSAIFFILLPAKIARPEITGSTIVLSTVAWIYSIDAPLNTFPSMHVSITTLVALVTLRCRRDLAKYVVPLALLVVLSTLFVKQHYFLDAVGGIVLGVLAYVAVFILTEAIDCSAAAERIKETVSLLGEKGGQWLSK
ncbi:MAG: phosphatase PAP2 family protein [Candidatus Woesearchaeota archaeon]